MAIMKCCRVGRGSSTTMFLDSYEFISTLYFFMIGIRLNTWIWHYHHHCLLPRPSCWTAFRPPTHAMMPWHRPLCSLQLWLLSCHNHLHLTVVTFQMTPFVHFKLPCMCPFTCTRIVYPFLRHLEIMHLSDSAQTSIHCNLASRQHVWYHGHWHMWSHPVFW